MAKFSGMIGFSITSETIPGVWEESIIEKRYFGDVIRNSKRWEHGEGINDNINISNQFSIIADPFACENFQYMHYISYMNAKWKISSVEVNYPRMTINVGGLYHEN